MAKKRKQKENFFTSNSFLYLLGFFVFLIFLLGVFFIATEGVDIVNNYFNTDSVLELPVEEGSTSTSTCQTLCEGAGYDNGEDNGDLGCSADETHILQTSGTDVLLDCCCSDDVASEPYEDPFTGYSPGEIIVSEQSDGVMGDGITSLINPIEMDDVITGGECSLGAKGYIYWDYVEEDPCMTLQGFESLGVYLYDSSTGRAIDTPRGETTSFDYCPLYYDGVTDWSFELNKIMGIYACNIDYQYELNVYVCDCPDEN